ncbi:MAG: DUF393 domain-containing protein [Nanoarchaeota archaeon]
MVKLKPKLKYLVIYDGSCHFCLSCMSVLQRLDWLGQLVYADFRKPSFAKENREKLKSLESELWLVSPTKEVYKGFFAFRKMATLLLPLWVFAPLLYLPFADVIGKIAYAYVSERRFSIGCQTCRRKNVS